MADTQALVEHDRGYGSSVGCGGACVAYERRVTRDDECRTRPSPVCALLRAEGLTRRDTSGWPNRFGVAPSAGGRHAEASVPQLLPAEGRLSPWPGAWHRRSARGALDLLGRHNRGGHRGRAVNRHLARGCGSAGRPRPHSCCGRPTHSSAAAPRQRTTSSSRSAEISRRW